MTTIAKSSVWTAPRLQNGDGHPSDSYDNRDSTVIVITVRNEVAKVMFLQACVCHGGEYLTRSPPGPGTPRTRYTPQTRYTPLGPGTPPPGTPPPQTRYTPLLRDQVHPPGTRYTPLDQVHPPPQTRYSPLGPGTPPRTRSPLGTRYTPPDTATAADGTHPTGMHSCLPNVRLKNLFTTVDCIVTVSATLTTRAPPPTPPSPRCENNYFRCRLETGVYQCIPRYRTCDGLVDCYAGSDEDSAIAGCASKCC